MMYKVSYTYSLISVASFPKNGKEALCQFSKNEIHFLIENNILISNSCLITPNSDFHRMVSEN